MPNETYFVDIGFKMAVREWHGRGRPFLLVHGLASNARLWDGVAALLAQAGHRVIAVDQRGHGRSDKLEDGYDFDTITADLRRLIEVLGLEKPYMAGQSWGGNVMLAFAARFPAVAAGFAFVDGGTIDFQADREATWALISERLKPPNMLGTPVELLRSHISQSHPAWPTWAVEAVLANFEVLADGTVRPWLTLERHLKILRALWEQRPPALYPLVRDPVFVALANDGNPLRVLRKEEEARAARAGLADLFLHWFPNTHHDIHLDKPDALAQHMLFHADGRE